MGKLMVGCVGYEKCPLKIDIALCFVSGGLKKPMTSFMDFSLLDLSIFHTLFSNDVFVEKIYF